MPIYRSDLADCRALMRAKRFEEAASMLESLEPSEEPTRYKLERHYLLGVCYRRLGRFSEAFDQLELVRRLDPRHKQVLLEVGKILTHVDPARAETFLTGVLQSDPKDRYAWLHRASARTALGRYEDAIEDVMEALRLDPAERRRDVMRATLWDHLLSLGLKKLHDRQRLRGFFAEILEMYPRSKDAWRYYATFLRKTLDYAAAAEAYARALALAPDDLEILRSIAHLHKRARHEEEEVHVIRQILELAPGDAKSRERLEWIEAKRKARRGPNGI